jgi:hypothetical protein
MEIEKISVIKVYLEEDEVDQAMLEYIVTKADRDII